MGILSSAISFVSSAVSTVSNVLGSAVGTVGSLAQTVLKVASPYLGVIVQVLQAVGFILDILKPDESVEELGDKSLRAEKKPEDFDTTQEYIDYLRNDVSFDQAEYDKLSESDKLARKAVGSSILMKVINEKKDLDITLDTWVSLAKLHDKDILKSDKIDSFLEEFKNMQEKLNGYVKNEIKGSEGIKVAGKMAEAYQKLEPELSKDEINEKVLRSKIDE